MGPPRPLLSALPAVVLLLLAPSASADISGQLPDGLPDGVGVSVDPRQAVEYQCLNLPCVGVTAKTCGGVLLVGAHTDILPGGGVYVEVSEPGGGVGAYGGQSSYCPSSGPTTVASA